jgi:hypothetical protein
VHLRGAIYARGSTKNAIDAHLQPAAATGDLDRRPISLKGEVVPPIAIRKGCAAA